MDATRLAISMAVLKEYWEEVLPSEFCENLNASIGGEVVVLIPISDWEEYQALKGLSPSERDNVKAVQDRIFGRLEEL